VEEGSTSTRQTFLLIAMQNPYLENCMLARTLRPARRELLLAKSGDNIVPAGILSRA